METAAPMMSEPAKAPAAFLIINGLPTLQQAALRGGFLVLPASDAEAPPNPGTFTETRF